MNLDTNPLEAQNMGKGVVTNTTKPSVSALVCHIFPSLLHRLFSTNPPPSFCYVVQWAMVGALRDTNSVFHEVVKQHFKNRKEVVLERAEARVTLSISFFFLLPISHPPCTLTNRHGLRRHKRNHKSTTSSSCQRKSKPWRRSWPNYRCAIVLIS